MVVRMEKPASPRSVTVGAATRTPPVLVSLGEGTSVPLATYPIWIGEVPHCMCACKRPNSWLGRHSRKLVVFLTAGGSTRVSTLIRP